MADLKGISTYGTYLMYRTTTSGTYTKLIDITSFPDLIPPKERIDITSLSDYMRVYINRVKSTMTEHVMIIRLAASLGMFCHRISTAVTAVMEALHIFPYHFEL